MKYILLCFLILFFCDLKAQVESVYPWEVEVGGGVSFPMSLKNERAADLNSGSNFEFVLDYHFSEKYFVTLKVNYAKHIYADIYTLNAFPIMRSKYFMPMFGILQKSGKFFFEEKFGYGMLYTRIPAYLSQKVGEYYFGKLSDESRTLLGEFNFSTAYYLTDHFALVLNSAVKFSQINWDITYNTYIESDIGLEYFRTDFYNQKLFYFPFSFTFGVTYRL